MVEKRYYQRDFEELYYIIDSNVISEKEFDEKEMYDGYTAFEDSMTGKEIVGLLNEQHEQIERLKGNFKALDEVKCELADENEKLKQFKEKVFTLIDKEIARNEKAIEWGKETGADSGAMEFYNHMLKRLKKELKE